MRAVGVIVLALSALIGVNAFASSFYTVKTYTGSVCTGTPSISVINPLDECVALTATTSLKASVVGGSLVLTTYTAAQGCTGVTAAPTNVTATGVCLTGFGSATAYAFPVSPTGIPLWSITEYSSSSCATGTLSSGPNYNYGIPTTACDASGVAVTMVNGPLQACTTTCNANCVNIPTGSCQTSTGQSGGEVYYSNGVGAQAVVTYATAALIAVAAIVLSL